jgi:hypothetical protein
MILLLFFIILLMFIMDKLSINSTPYNPCHIKGLPHKWIEKVQDKESYLVCEQCGMLPGGDFEQR